MARRIPRVPFNADGPFVARRIFTFNGARTVPGEPFPHDGVKVRRLKSLHRSRHIEMMGAMQEMAMRMQHAVEETQAEVAVDNSAMLERTAKLKAVVLATLIPIVPAVVAAPADWRHMDDKALLAHTFEVTGVRRRNVTIARAALESLDNGVTIDRKAS